MDKINEVNIEEISTTYRVRLLYHSDRKCQNYDAQIEVSEEGDGTISIEPNHCGSSFEFRHSDPDRVIAIAQMILASAQMVKNRNKKDIDISDNL